MKKLAGVMLIVVTGVFVAAALAGTRPKPAVAATQITRYSIVHGCYSLSTPSGRLGPFRGRRPRSASTSCTPGRTGSSVPG